MFVRLSRLAAGFCLVSKIRGDRSCFVRKNIDSSGLRLWNAELHLNQMTDKIVLQSVEC